MLYLAALLIVASVALFVAAPLDGGLLTSRRIRDAAEAERLEHELGLAMQGLRELDFDREMGKLSDADCKALRERLMARALGAAGALERLRAKPMHASSATAAVAIAPAAQPRLVKAAATAGPNASAPATTPLVRFCPKCGVEVMRGKFCSECGAPLLVPAGAAQVGRRAQRLSKPADSAKKYGADTGYVAGEG